ncbi:hypothetical protein ACG5V6_18985 [Streptomyces chitinivorans]|uniref:Uncharacterized protein n=1 Tax=Streptomyces chitinivorans TaxID=1257027 RepID=A0ABW7HWM3_9ACTN|nr:hypothetical protein [Streptomyces chitinivorans]MDH2407440.1 hypothetical protein [Streptomyces chitinivorans]
MRANLPPPPPPVHLWAWPDRAALLADRGRALAALDRRLLSPGRLLLLWALTALGSLSWMLWTAFLKTLPGASPAYLTEYVLSAVLLLLAVATLAASAVGLTVWTRRGGAVRWLLADWATVDGEPAAQALPPGPASGAAPSGEPATTGGARRWVWLLVSLPACAVGAALLISAALAAGPDADPYDLAAVAGVAVPLLTAGALGLTTCVTHRRALRLASPGPSGPSE